MDKRPTAIITYWERWWPLIQKVSASFNINIPKDLSVITFNDTAIASHSFPSLTAVDVGISRMGDEAAEMLYKKVYENEALSPTVVVPEKLVIRNSTATFKNS